VSQLALGKEGGFAECCQEDTRQRYLRCRVSPLTLGKAAVSVTRRRTTAFFCRVLPGTRQTSLPSAREKVLDKEVFADALFAECYTRQSLCRVFLRLRRVLQALDEAIDSGSASAKRPYGHSRMREGAQPHHTNYSYTRTVRASHLT
jgi:hypothetical protein